MIEEWVKLIEWQLESNFINKAIKTAKCIIIYPSTDRYHSNKIIRPIQLTHECDYNVEAHQSISLCMWILCLLNVCYLYLDFLRLVLASSWYVTLICVAQPPCLLFNHIYVTRTTNLKAPSLQSVFSIDVAAPFSTLNTVFLLMAFLPLHKHKLICQILFTSLHIFQVSQSSYIVFEFRTRNEKAFVFLLHV